MIWKRLAKTPNIYTNVDGTRFEFKWSIWDRFWFSVDERRMLQFQAVFHVLDNVNMENTATKSHNDYLDLTFRYYDTTPFAKKELVELPSLLTIKVVRSNISGKYRILIAEEDSLPFVPLTFITSDNEDHEDKLKAAGVDVNALESLIETLGFMEACAFLGLQFWNKRKGYL